MITPHIRKARAGDESAIHEAHMRSIREVCVKDHGEEEIRGWGNRPLGSRWIDPIKEGDVWVVERNSNIYGLAYIRIFAEDGESKAHIHGLYLTPEILGQGFGYKLAQLMFEKARASGVKSITLDSTITAHGFYKRLGFTNNGPMRIQEFGGYPVRGYPMLLHLV